MPLTARMSLMEVSQSAVVDLQESQAFSEPFYVVVIEKENLLDSKQSDSFGSLGSKSSTARRHNDTEGTSFPLILYSVCYFLISTRFHRASRSYSCSRMETRNILLQRRSRRNC